MYTEVADELGFDWDDANIEHIARHQVTPQEAEQVILNGPVEIDYQAIDREERSVVAGMTKLGRFLTIVWTDRAGLVRAAYVCERGQ